MEKYWFIFCKSEILLEKTPDGKYTIPLQEDAPLDAAAPLGDIHNITPLDTTPVKTYNTQAVTTAPIGKIMVNTKKMPIAP